MQGLAYVDGLVVDLGQARVPLLDRGYLLGDGVFETLRVSNGHVFRPRAHRDRLAAGLRVLGLEPALADSYDQAIEALLAAARGPLGDDLYLRVNLTTGVTEDLAGSDAGASVTAYCKPFHPYPMQYYAQGVRVVQSPMRVDSRDPLVTVKTLSFIRYVAARRAAHAVAAHDALLQNEHGRLTEATTSNIFARSGDTVHAPGAEEGALPGVTRDVVLEFLEDIGLTVKASLTPEQLRGADEAWLSNTTGGVVPVVRYGDDTVGDGEPGEVSRRLRNAYEDLVRGA